MQDKRVWLKWMELRCHGDVEAIKTPIGYLPLYSDLKNLFKKVLGKDYTLEQYHKQFTLRIPQNIARMERMIKIYENIPETPQTLFEILENQKKELIKAREKLGDYPPPESFLSSP